MSLFESLNLQQFVPRDLAVIQKVCRYITLDQRERLLIRPSERYFLRRSRLSWTLNTQPLARNALIAFGPMLTSPRSSVARSIAGSCALTFPIRMSIYRRDAKVGRSFEASYAQWGLRARGGEVRFITECEIWELNGLSNHLSHIINLQKLPFVQTPFWLVFCKLLEFEYWILSNFYFFNLFFLIIFCLLKCET